MAIIQCRECGKDVSSEAVVCPHCGVQLKLNDFQKAKQSGGNFIKWVFGIIGALFFIGLINYLSTPEYEIEAIRKRDACLEVVKITGQFVMRSVCESNFGKEMQAGYEKYK
ncbi:MAG TPA: zinc ribbon domain-containing protein [Aquabacterium sp.]|nr:zinc ribbon domain-containing protein [Aquabacterium sp.]HRH27571.1 zinc ribbon domain-containing protein [Aquabacterium sp.]